MDSRQIVAARESGKNSVYECYYWENVPANCFAVDGDRLWFGTEDGRVCLFKDNSYEEKCYSDDGEAIKAVWQTAVEDEGCIQNFKTLKRKGCVVTLKPFNASSCKIYYKVDGGKAVLIKNSTMDISELFEKVKFERMGFNSFDSPREIYFNRRQRKYKRLQLIFENDRVNEGFGIYKIVKTYQVNGNSKNIKY